jgi:hypothetical protein
VGRLSHASARECLAESLALGMQFCAAGETVKDLPPLHRNDWSHPRGATRQSSPDSETRFAVARKPSIAPPAGAFHPRASPLAPPPAPVLPPMRRPADSWTARAWIVPAAEEPAAHPADDTTRSGLTASAPALLLVAAAAFLAATLALFFLRLDAAKPPASTAAAAPAAPTAVVEPPAAPLAAPPVDAAGELEPELASIPAPSPQIAARAPRPSHADASAKRPPVTEPAAASKSAKAAKDAEKEKKSLEELLAELGEEQLRR